MPALEALGAPAFPRFSRGIASHACVTGCNADTLGYGLVARAPPRRGRGAAHGSPDRHGTVARMNRRRSPAALCVALLASCTPAGVAPVTHPSETPKPLPEARVAAT